MLHIYINENNQQQKIIKWHLEVNTRSSTKDKMEFHIPLMDREKNCANYFRGLSVVDVGKSKR